THAHGGAPFGEEALRQIALAEARRRRIATAPAVACNKKLAFDFKRQWRPQSCGRDNGCRCVERGRNATAPAARCAGDPDCTRASPDGTQPKDTCLNWRTVERSRSSCRCGFRSDPQQFTGCSGKMPIVPWLTAHSQEQARTHVPLA